MSASQSNVCIFCQSIFTRPDALKRHWNTCSARRDAAIEIPNIPPKSRGRRPKACDQCSSLKRACVPLGSKQSCELCTTKRISCSYRRLSRKISDRRERIERHDATSVSSLALLTRGIEESQPSRDSWRDRDFTSILHVEYSMANHYNRRPTNVQLSLATSLPFFFKVSQSIGLASTFECGTPADRSRICRYALELSVYKSDSPSSSAYATPSFIDDLLSCQIDSSNAANASWAEKATEYSLESELGFDLSADSVVSEVSGLIYQLPSFHPEGTSCRLSSRCQQIIDRLRDATIHSRQGSVISVTWSSSLEKICHQLFSEPNQERFLALYWSSWYPNWPTIHQPTFDPMRSNIDLVITMILMGACLSPHQTDRSMASIWFDTIEELIFSADDFSSYHDDQSQPENTMNWLNDRLGLLQAAYCICLLQTWEGSKESKRRIRRHRYNSLIWLARDTGFQYGTLKSVSTEDLASFDWKAFIVRESFIRIITYIYNLDSAYAMFCSQPPRLLYNELHIGLTAPELCFQANSAEECFVLLKAWRNTFCHTDLSLVKTVQMICSDRTIFSDTLFCHMSVLNMFTIIHVLYAMAFQVEKLFMPTIDTAWLQKGLENWRDLWPSPSRDEEIALGAVEADTKFSRRTGFTQHAPEIWFLAHSSLNQTIQKKEMGAAALHDHTEAEGTGMAHLRSMVDRFRIGVS